MNQYTIETFYGIPTKVAFNQNPEIAFKFLMESNGCVYPEPEDGEIPAYGLAVMEVIPDVGPEVFLALQPDTSASIIVHESVHCALLTLNSITVDEISTADTLHHETLAYLTQYITGKVLEFQIEEEGS